MPRRDRSWRPSIWTFVAPGALLVAVIVVSVVLLSTFHGRSGASPSSSSSVPTTTAAGTAAAAPPTATPTSYVVRTGDTLSGIARRLGISLDAIIALNPKLDPQHLRPGVVLALP